MKIKLNNKYKLGVYPDSPIPRIGETVYVKQTPNQKNDSLYSFVVTNVIYCYVGVPEISVWGDLCFK